MGIFRTHLLSLLSSPQPILLKKKKKKSNLFQVTLNCRATETGKMVLKSPHSRIVDGLNHAASTIPKLSLGVHLSGQDCQPLE